MQFDMVVTSTVSTISWAIAHIAHIIIFSKTGRWNDVA